MAWNYRSRRSVQHDMRKIAASYRPVVLVIPVETGTAKHDQMTDSALDPTDTTVSNTGQTITWKTQTIFARLAGPTFTDLVMANSVGYNHGDLGLFIKVADQASLAAVQSDSDAYIYIDGETYKPFGGADKAGVYRYDELRISCNKVSPRLRATGY